MAVVKNNAYGHGLKEISEYLDKDEDMFVLDILYKNGLGDLYEKNSEKFKTLLSFVEK